MPLHTTATATPSVLPIGAEALESYEAWDLRRDFRKALWRSRLGAAREALRIVLGLQSAKNDSADSGSYALRARDEAFWLTLRERVREGRSMPASARGVIMARELARDIGPGPGRAEAPGAPVNWTEGKPQPPRKASSLSASSPA